MVLCHHTFSFIYKKKRLRDKPEAFDIKKIKDLT